MSSPSVARHGLVGAQQPRISLIPEFVSSAGSEAVDLCRMAGLHLDPWEELVLANALGERADGRWSAFEVGVMVSRQNGKGAILEARELAGLFLLGERLIVHSAHQFDTSLEAFRRLLALIEDTPDLERRVKRISRSHGEEGIELRNGQRIRFRTRTKGGGRGFTSDCLILDEAMDLPLSAHGALLPTLSARPNPQVWYTGSAVDQDVHEHGLVFARIRERGLKGDGKGLAYFEWSVDADLDTVDTSDRDGWAEANPGLGIRIGVDHVALEHDSMDPRTFAVERLGVGDWPRLDGLSEDGLDVEAWEDCEDRASITSGPVCFAFDVTPDRQRSSVAVAGFRPDGRPHVEVVQHKSRTNWIIDELIGLRERHDCGPIIFDQRSPAAALLAKLVEAGVPFKAVGAGEHAQGCGIFYDAVEERSLRHLGQPDLSAAARGAVKRPLGDAWAWSRKNSHVDISPLVACTLALWGIASDRTTREPLIASFGR